MKESKLSRRNISTLCGSFPSSVGGARPGLDPLFPSNPSGDSRAKLGGANKRGARRGWQNSTLNAPPSLFTPPSRPLPSDLALSFPSSPPSPIHFLLFPCAKSQILQRGAIGTANCLLDALFCISHIPPLLFRAIGLVLIADPLSREPPIFTAASPLPPHGYFSGCAQTSAVPLFLNFFPTWPRLKFSASRDSPRP
jgi:hypothetical protein